MKPKSIDHLSLFLLGWLYYLFVPLVFVFFQIFADSDFLSLFYIYFDQRNAWFFYFVIFVLLMLPAYGLGFLVLGRGSQVRSLRLFRVKNPSIPSFVLFCFYGLLLIIFSYNARSLLGSGYVDGYDSSVMGPLATLQMLLIYQYLYSSSARHKLAYSFLVLLFINSLILLSMGGRLYVLSAVVAIYFRWWNWSAVSFAAQMRSIGAIFGFFFFLIIIGMWRVGETNNFLFVQYLFAEALFTAISAVTLFTGGYWSALFDVPIDFFISFFNIIPSVLWHEKNIWIEAVSNLGVRYESPLGASSIVANSVGNFGFVGALVFFILAGFYMTHASRTRNEPAKIAYYCYLSGLIPFLFFRDPFAVLIKVVLTGFVISKLPNVTRKFLSIACKPACLT